MHLKQVTGRKLLCKIDPNKTKVSEGGILFVRNKENYDIADVLQVGGKCTEIKSGQKVVIGNGRGHQPDLEDNSIRAVAEYDAVLVLTEDKPPQAVGNRLLVKLLPRPKEHGSILLPDYLRYQFDTALIITAGNDLKDPELLKPGNKVIFKYGHGSPFGWKGENYLVLQEESMDNTVLLVIEQGEKENE